MKVPTNVTALRKESAGQQKYSEEIMNLQVLSRNEKHYERKEILGNYLC